MLSSNSNRRLDQKAAAKQLLQYALESSSSSDLTALAGDECCSDNITAAAMDSAGEEAQSKEEAEHMSLPHPASTAFPRGHDEKELVLRQVDPDLQQAVPGHVVAVADSATVDVGCQALLLCTAGLPVVGPPGPCRVCPLVQQQLAEMQAKLIQAQQQQQQALLSGEHHRHQSMLTEAQLATARQKLRQHVASAARPLAMSGWEDLIDEAAADLERLETHVAAAATRLIELQASASGAAEALTASARDLERRQAAAADSARHTEEVAALELQAAELDEASSSQQKAQLEHQQQAAAAAQQWNDLVAEVATAQQQLDQLLRQAEAARGEADLCSRAAAAADRHLLEVQQQLATLQAGTAPSMQQRSSPDTVMPGQSNARPVDAVSTVAVVAATSAAQFVECAQLQVKLAAAESRRQLAEERSEEAERRLSQVKAELADVVAKLDATEKQLRSASSKGKSLKDKLRTKDESPDCVFVTPV
eukprot:gene4786-5036_t